MFTRLATNVVERFNDQNPRPVRVNWFGSPWPPPLGATLPADHRQPLDRETTISAQRFIVIFWNDASSETIVHRRGSL